MVFQHRLARRADLEQIVAIYNSTVASRMVTADTEPVPVESRVAWFSEHSPGKRPLWVAEHEGRIAGWLSFSSFYGRTAYDHTAEVSIYVHESFRSKGLGRYFLAQALASAPAIQVHTILGFIFGHNLPSLALFEKFGFSRWGVLPKVAVLDGVERDVVVVGYRVDAE